MTLLDPEKFLDLDCLTVAKDAAEAGTAAIMVGGSTIASNSELDDVVKKIKSVVKVPVILFPNNLTGFSKYADAIWFMSLLNSSNPYYIIDAQALAAFTIRKNNLETLPMGYIIIGNGGTAGYVGNARGIPLDKPELALAYSLAAEFLGMRYIYLEAGSGVKNPVPASMISLVRKYITGTLVVGGAIRSPEAAKNAKEAGAHIIVTGNLVENGRVKEKLSELINSIKS
jgi:phosphoglycerol geranylgeranyltransferase